MSETKLDVREFDLGVEFEQTNAFIQWKGTDVCMDFHCDCGAEPHVDGYFAHAVRCYGCGTVWQMPMVLFPRKVMDVAAYQSPIFNTTPDDDPD